MRRIQKVIIATYLFSFIASFLLVSCIPNSAIIEKKGTSIDNDIELPISSAYIELNSPLVIDGNESFYSLKVNSWCTGNGSAVNPYVIRGIYINGQNEQYCLIIKNIDENFTITECYFKNSANDKAAICLEKVKNGKIINNTFYSNGCGLLLSNCSYNDITLNIFKGNLIAIRISPAAALSNVGNTFWKNLIVYSIMTQIQIFTDKNSLNNASGNQCGNYWSNFNYEFDKNKNHTFQFEGTTITLFVAKSQYNISIDPDIQDNFPLIANDTDKDGLDDLVEIIYWETSTTSVDTDGDGMPDGWECINKLDPNKDDAEDDADDDDLENLYEYEEEYEHDDGSIHFSDPNDDDTDNDGWTDGDEVDEKTDPTNYFDHPEGEEQEELIINDIPMMIIDILLNPTVLILIGVVAIVVVAIIIRRKIHKTVKRGVTDKMKANLKKKEDLKKAKKQKKIEKNKKPTEEEE